MALELEGRWQLGDLQCLRRGLKKLGLNTLDRYESYFERTIILRRCREEDRKEYRLRIIVRRGGLRGPVDTELWFGRKSETEIIEGLRSRNEHEERLDSSLGVEKVLSCLRLRELKEDFIYEDIRKDIPLMQTCVSLRTFPFIGNWVEIEGDHAAIHRTLKLFGFRIENAVTKSWKEIFREYCAKNGVGAENMTFAEAAKWQTK